MTQFLAGLTMINKGHLMFSKYQNLYSKWLYTSNKKPYGDGYLEVQLHKYPFHSGLRVLVTDGYRYIRDIHCSSITQAKNELRKQYKLICDQAGA